MWLPTLPVLCTVLLFTAQRSSADPDVGTPEGEYPEPLEEGEEQCTAERHAQGLCHLSEHSPFSDMMNEATELGNEATDDKPPPKDPQDEAFWDAKAAEAAEAAEIVARQGEAKAVGAAPQHGQPAKPPPDVVGDNNVLPPATDATTHAQAEQDGPPDVVGENKLPPPATDETTHAEAEQAVPHMDQRFEEPVRPPPTTTTEPLQGSSLGGGAAQQASAGIGMPMAESVHAHRSNPSTTAEPRSELPGWVFGVNTDWKGAVVAVYSITGTLSQWLGSLAGDVLQAGTNLTNAKPPLNIIMAIFAMFLAVLLFFRVLPSTTVTNSGAPPTQLVPPVSKPPPVAASAESTAALAALRQQVDEVRQGLQHLGAELRWSVSENGQGVQRLATEIRSFQQERIAIDAELLLSAKEILEWVSDNGHSGGAASTNGLSMAAGCPQPAPPLMAVPKDQHQPAHVVAPQSIGESSAGPVESFPQQALIAPVAVPGPPEQTAPVPVAPVTIQSSSSEPALPAQELADRVLPKVAPAIETPPVPEAGKQPSPSPAQPQHLLPPEPQMPELQEMVAPAAPATPAQAPPVPKTGEGPSWGSTSQPSPPLAQPQHVHPPEPQMPELQEKASAAEPVLNPDMGGWSAQQPGARPKQQAIQAAANPFARPQPQPIQAPANPFGARRLQQPIQAASNPFGPR